MARKIQLRRDTAAAWSASNPTLAQGEVGIDLTNNKIKIGDGTTVWNSLAYFDDKVTDFSAVATNIVPDADDTRDLGAPDKQWRHVYTAGGSIYLDDVKLTNVNGKLVATKVINPGTVNEAPHPTDSDATINISNANLGNLKIESSTLGTKGADSNSWGNHNLYLDPGGESNAYISIPSVPNQEEGNALQIYNKGDASSIVQVFGQGGVQVVTNTGVTENLFEFTDNGTLNVPYPSQDSFRIRLGSENFVSRQGKTTLTLTGDAWDFYGAFVSSQNGERQLAADNGPLPSITNPGYEDGDTFEIDSTVHGITGYVLTVALDDVVQAGPAGWTANLAFSPPPDYPSTVNSQGAIKVTSNNNSWVFGTDGELTLPGSLKVSNAPEGSIIGEGGVSINAKNGYQFSAAYQRAEILNPTPGYNANVAGFYLDGNGATIEINTDDTGNSWTFDTTGNLTLPVGGDILDSTGVSVLGGSGEGLPTVTVPGEVGTTYKGLQVSYGMVHSNVSTNELNVNKIVIHKPAATTTTIHPTSSQDDFEVTGLGSSDVLAMFVIFGNTNGPKPLSELQTFAEAVIDNVILDGGVEGDYNTVELMKTAFYTNYPILATGGLDLDFQFFEPYSNATTGATTVQERSGAGAQFQIADNGDGTYGIGTVTIAGTNYRVGHKILVLGTDLGGATPDNDCIVSVDSVDGNGGITALISPSGTAAGGTYTLYNNVSGTNYQVSSGFIVAGVGKNNDGTLYTNTNAQGSGYVVGDVLTLLGAELQNGATPANNITITITQVDGSGTPQTWNTTGTFPNIWSSNSISDGGNDQYDTANYINTSLASQISYNGGNTVADGTAAFGAGSSYTFVYDVGIFGLLVTGNQSTLISTSGGSGADGESITEAGNLYGPNTAAQTFDNAVTHINLIGDPYAGAIVSFTHSDNGNEVDILIPDDGDGAGVGITRDGNNGIYNPYRDDGWDEDVSPSGTLWNIDGWADLSDVESRTYDNLYAAFGNGGLGNKIVGAECVMYLPDNGKYYAVKFSAWTQNNNGGGFAYTRRELDLTSLTEGIRFADGTRLKSAEGLGRVKLESPGARRIEEVHGYKSVSVTPRQVITITTTASRSVINQDGIWINSASTTIDDIFNNFEAYEVVQSDPIQFSLDNTTWYNYSGSRSIVGNETVLSITTPVTYNQGATIYFRYTGGGTPRVWWDKNELPGGGGNFRGAIIDYHAYTGSGTIIGTIHIVDDDGEENITHTEVSSGGTSNEYDDLWFVTTEGQIKYRRIDSSGRTLKVQWTAKVFYGSELYD